MRPSDLLVLFKKYPRICTDTRRIQPGDLFFALKGERFDGNTYAKKALEQGAAYAIMDNPQFVDPENDHMISVEDSLKSLQELAKLYRASWDFPVLGLTGSNGKTTTKELIASVLRQEQRIFATQGNYNNHIGVPLTLLATPTDVDLAIVEMGTNQPGDILQLAEIADPDLALITNIGQAHLEKLGSVAGIREEKAALFRWVMDKEGPIYWNQADPHLEIAVGDYPEAISFGAEGSKMVGTLLRNTTDGMHIRLQYAAWEAPLEIHSALSGTYNLPNILAAALIGCERGISRDHIKAGLEAYRPQNNRSQVVQQGGYTILLDAYNANPTSMQASIKNAFSLGKEKVALILGDMLELGAEATELHADIGHLINAYTPHVTVALGPHMQAMYAVVSGKKASFRDVEHASSQIAELVRGADLVLIKGSRGMALEQLVDVIAPKGEA